MNKPLWTRTEMQKMNIELLEQRGVTIKEIAEIAFNQQSKFADNVSMQVCVESVEKILSYRDIFHLVQLGIEIDMLVEEGRFKGPIQEILMQDLGVFGLDEVFGLEISGKYGSIGQTNFGDIDVNKPGVIGKFDRKGKSSGSCHTFLDDIIGALAAAASTRVAQIINEEHAEDIERTQVIQIKK